MIINILNNKSVWKAMALISYSPGAGYTRDEIKKLLNWNNLSLDRTLSKLLFYKIIKKEGRILKLNLGNPETELILEIIGKEKARLNFPAFEIFIVLHELIRLIEGHDVDSLYLFGSHAKKTASNTSDIDIGVFSYGKVNLIGAKDMIEQEYGKNVQMHYFKVGDKGKLVDEVMKHGVKLL